MTSERSSPRYHPQFPKSWNLGEKFAGLPDFITEFYQVSDSPGQDKQWLAFFTPDAELTMGTKHAKGTEEVFRVRQGMWETVAERKHKVFKVFPAHFEDENSAEFMLFGSVWYKQKSGDDAVVDWAGHARVVRNEAGALKFGSYRVYLQSK